MEFGRSVAAATISPPMCYNQVMNSKVDQIKDLIKKECSTSSSGKEEYLNIFDFHLLGVEKWAKELLKELPEADEEVVMLGVWLHDLQRIRGLEGDHAEVGAIEAEKVLKQFGYSDEIIEHVKEMVLAHRCDDDLLPQTLEGKILASADAMSHYFNDFYLGLAISGKRDLPSFKKWALEKLDRDYNKKIFFDFARKKIEKRHRVLQEFLTMG